MKVGGEPVTGGRGILVARGRRRGQGPQVRIRLELDPALGSIEADRGRLRQILHNLLTNAFEALEGQAGTSPASWCPAG